MVVVGGRKQVTKRSTHARPGTPPPCISYANVHNYCGPYAYCSLDKGVAYTKGGGGMHMQQCPAVLTRWAGATHVL